MFSSIKNFITWIKNAVGGMLASNRRSSTTKIWIGVNLLYDVFQAGIMTLIFKRHGLNGKAYLAFILLFSIPFSFASFRLTVAIVENNAKKAAIYGLASIASFYAPDAYIIINTHNVPKGLYVLLGMYLLITSIVVVRRVLKKPANPSSP